jgi:hypothetical protein
MISFPALIFFKTSEKFVLSSPIFNVSIVFFLYNMGLPYEAVRENTFCLL